MEVNLGSLPALSHFAEYKEGKALELYPFFYDVVSLTSLSVKKNNLSVSERLFFFMLLQFLFNFYNFVSLDHVADFDVVVVFDAQTTF